MAYSSKVVDRFEDVLKNPAKHGVGRFDPKDPNVVTGLAGAPACGDVMKLAFIDIKKAFEASCRVAWAGLGAKAGH